MSKEAVRAVIKEFGSQKNTAAGMNVCQQYIGNWIRQGYIPIKYLKGIVKTTKVPIRDLIHPDYLEAVLIIKEQEDASV